MRKRDAVRRLKHAQHALRVAEHDFLTAHGWMQGDGSHEDYYYKTGQEDHGSVWIFRSRAVFIESTRDVMSMAPMTRATELP